MKNKGMIKGFIAGILCMAMFITLATGAAAASATKTITIAPGITIYIDGQKLTPKDANGKAVEVFTYNGTTYLPVRAIGEAYDKDIKWDGSTRSVYVNSKSSASEDAVSFADLDYFNSNMTNGFMGTTASVKDNTGTVHTDAFKLSSKNSVNSGHWCEYLINGEYSRISGTAFISYDQRNIYSSNSVLRIYGDDKLLYTSDYFTSGSVPQSFSVDLTGVDKLKVQSMCVDATYGPNIFLGECILEK